MWENETKKTWIRNIVIFIVLVIVAGALLVTMLQVKKQIDAEDEQLESQSSNQRQELSEVRQENLDVIQQGYDADMQTAQEYLPGIICWGDSLTAGSSGNVSFPAILQKYINIYLCDVYDFRSTVANPQDYDARVDWEDYTLSVPVVNMGAGMEDSATVLGRSGVRPYIVSKAFTIPATCEAVSLSISSMDKKQVNPLTAGNGGLNPVTIAGVQGTLSLVSQSYGQYSYDFTRLEAGSEVEVEAGTQITAASTDEYRDYIHVIWLGTYGEYTTASKLVEDTKNLLARQNVNTDRYLVLGPCTLRGSWTNADSNTLDTLDSAMLQAFGSHYINVRKYLMVDGATDAKLTLSREDKQLIQQGKVPSVFRSNASGADLNGAAYRLIGKLVYERMDRLGFFEEVRQELGLDKSTQELLKEDPDYFTKLINAT